MTEDLWREKREGARRAVEPLAARMRPRTLDEFVGQAHVLGEGRLLRRLLDADRLTSLIFWGPPGTGKTTLAHVIAMRTKSHFEKADASSIGVREVRRVIDEADQRLQESGQRTVFFLDEIHRFSRNQQDVLLGDVERGVIILIGATTENPSFAVNSPLASRSTVFRFEPLSVEEIGVVVRAAIADRERGFGAIDLRVTDEAVHHWAVMSDGDARKGLSALEVAVLSSMAKGGDKKSGATKQVVVIDLATAQESIQRKAVVYDGTGDEHYDVASALIKSMRGSDPDAAVYWLARMLDAGEDPRFIARRVAILASEDIGNADPNAIVVAAAAWEITERVGMPECQLTLGQAVLYMAMAPKSNASAKAIWDAMTDVKEGRTIAVPKSLRDAHYFGAAGLGHGEGYRYAHDAPGGVVEGQDLGVNKEYYQPKGQGLEGELFKRLADLRKAHRGEKA